MRQKLPVTKSETNRPVLFPPPQQLPCHGDDVSKLAVMTPVSHVACVHARPRLAGQKPDCAVSADCQPASCSSAAAMPSTAQANSC